MISVKYVLTYVKLAAMNAADMTMSIAKNVLKHVKDVQKNAKTQ